MASVTFSYSGKTYSFEDDERAFRGKLACDCGKSLLIRLACDPDFPVLQCGSDITLVSVDDGTKDAPASDPRRRII